GPGGVGKTRLALRLAADASADFADGVWFVGLAAVRHPALVASAVAEVLEIREPGDQPLASALATGLRPRQALLVLDNFEHVAAAAPLVADLLAACPRLKLLVTSRAPLRLRPEQEVPVSPLALPVRTTPSPDEALAESPAVAMFVQRARAVRPDFEL